MEPYSNETILNEFRQRFAKLQEMVDVALQQVPPEKLKQRLSDQSNSLLTIMKHVAGNMRSRWTDFLTTDGEKPDRYRDQEFDTESDTVESVRKAWQQGWQIFNSTLSSLRPEDLQATIHIRGEAHSVLEALFRQLTHYSYHVGQIVFLARECAGTSWQSLSIAKGQSQQFNQNPTLHNDQLDRRS